MIVTTTNSVEGRTVADYLGVVTAQAVLGINAFKDMSAGVRNVFGGHARSYENELGEGVAGVLHELEKQATTLSADAVLSVDVDYETVGDRMLMISASGTAVRLG